MVQNHLSRGWCRLWWAGPSGINKQSRQFCIDMPTGQSNSGNFFSCSSLFPGDSGMCQVDNKNEAAHGVSSLAVWGQNTQLWALKSETLPTVHNIWPSTLIIPGCYFSADSYESGTCRERHSEEDHYGTSGAPPEDSLPMMPSSSQFGAPCEVSMGKFPTSQTEVTLPQRQTFS